MSLAFCQVSETFFKYVRMPYTDNWRVDDKVVKAKKYLP